MRTRVEKYIEVSMCFRGVAGQVQRHVGVYVVAKALRNHENIRMPKCRAYAMHMSHATNGVCYGS